MAKKKRCAEEGKICRPKGTLKNRATNPNCAPYSGSELSQNSNIM